MLDTLALALTRATTSAPSRPMRVVAMTEARPVQVREAKQTNRPDFATTCHLNANGTCWSE